MPTGEASAEEDGLGLDFGLWVPRVRLRVRLKIPLFVLFVLGTG